MKLHPTSAATGKHGTEIRHSPFSLHSACRILNGALFLAVLSASAKTVYVTPAGSGDMDGTSWDNSDPLLLPADKKRNGVFARGISSRSPRRKAGVDVYCGDDGLLYVKWTGAPCSASNPWTCLTQHQTHLTPAQALTLGVSEESPMPRDAFGNERVAGRMAIGPLNPASPGTTISVK